MEVFTLIAIVLFVLAVRKARSEDRKIIASRRVGCAACRGERGGEVVLLPDTAVLCPEHWQRRHRIQHLEGRLLP